MSTHLLPAQLLGRRAFRLGAVGGDGDGAAALLGRRRLLARRLGRRRPLGLCIIPATTHKAASGGGG